ncbi:MAG: peptidyl-prolyl cis-trans isomerase [Acidobacteriota bacterium]|nr:peptidyl-prolyl cis-trans isomerase [Acidobacteriota bacterium]
MILDLMRRRKRLFAWLFLPLLVVGLVAYLIPGAGMRWGQEIGAPFVAQVGSAEISPAELRDALFRFLRSSRVPYDRKLLRQLRIEQQILNQLISREIVFQQGRRLGVDATSEEIQEKILTVPAFLEEGNFFLQRYKAILRQNGLTVEQFEESIRYEIMQEKLRGLVTEYVNVSDWEAEEDYRLRNEQARIRYAVVDPTSFKEQVFIALDEIKAHYEENKPTYRIPEQRQIEYLLADTGRLRAAFEPTVEEMQDYYRNNRSEFQVQEQVQASHILFKTAGESPESVKKIRQKAGKVLEEAKAGKDFAQLAQRHSEDGSAANGGDLGFFGRGRMVPEFERAAFGLAKGEISDLVTTQFGLHIIKVLEKQAARTQAFDEVKGLIESSLTSERVEAAARDLADKAYRQTRDERSFDEIAEELNLVTETSSFFSAGAPIPGIGNAPDLSTRVFSMSEGAVSAPQRVPNGFVLARLVQVKPSQVPELEEVRRRVEQDLTARKSDVLAQSKAEDLVEKVKAGRKFSSAARRARLEVKLSDPFSRNGSIPDLGSSTPLDEFAFSAKVGEVSEPIQVGRRLVVAFLTERKDIDPEEFAAEKEEIRDRLLTRKRQTVFDAFLEGTRTRMQEEGKILVNQSRLDEISAQF